MVVAEDFHQQWSMSGGMTCTNNFNVGPVSNFQIVQRPKHGVAGANNAIGSYGFAYKPNDKFVGDDEFTVSFTFTSPIDQSKLKKRIIVSVTVGK